MAKSKRGALRVRVTYGPDGAVVDSPEFTGYAPVLADPRPKAGTDAYWITLEGGGRRFARRLPDPASGRELFDPDGSITRAPGEQRTVTVDLPWWNDGSEVVVHGPGPQPPVEAAFAKVAVKAPAWRELGRFRPDAEAKALKTFAAPAPPPPPPFPVVALPFGTGQPRALKLVFLAEGFTAAELGLYRAVVDRFLHQLAGTPPFDTMTAALGALRIDSVSAQSGIDDGAAQVNTWLDGRFGVGAMRRLIEVNRPRALAAARSAAGASPFVTLVVVNTGEYGGSGGEVAVFSREDSASDIALHELGHTLFGLADEYSDPVPGVGAPAEPNVTLKPNPASPQWGPTDLQRLKWRAQLTPGIALPTMANPNCGLPDNRPPPVGVGAFEGGKYRHCRVFRPSGRCKMRNLTDDFCPVCRGVITAKLRAFL